MMWIALAAAAAQMSMPSVEQSSVLAIFSADDVPTSLIPSGESRRVDVRVTVGPDGKMRSCGAEFSSGIPQLDAYTCQLIRRRAQFRPAIWTDGSPAFGVIRKGITWSVNAPPFKGSSDIDVTVADLPRGIKSPAYVLVMFAVDEAGHPSSCVEQQGVQKHSGSKITPDLIKIACDQIIKNYVAIPARDDAGRPVHSVQEAVVRFSRDQRR